MSSFGGQGDEAEHPFPVPRLAKYLSFLYLVPSIYDDGSDVYKDI